VGKDPNLLKETAPDTAVLTCMYRTLQLGFVGQYRAQDDERREDIVRALARVPTFTLAQDAPIVSAHQPAQRPSLVLAELGCGCRRPGCALVLPFVFAYRAGKPDRQAGVSDAGCVPKSVNCPGYRTGAVAHSGILATVLR
jgi:hypothetical protein